MILRVEAINSQIAMNVPTIPNQTNPTNPAGPDVAGHDLHGGVGGTLKWWVGTPTNPWGFFRNEKYLSTWGGDWGYHPFFRKHPYTYIYHIYIYSKYIHDINAIREETVYNFQLTTHIGDEEDVSLCSDSIGKYLEPNLIPNHQVTQ